MNAVCGVDRLAALRRYDILDSEKEPAYDDIVFLASQICEAPMALISFVEESRQWFKAELGVGARQTSLEVSICAHGLLQEDVFEIPDTLEDERFRNNPLCTGDPHLRFYAGAPLRTSDGLVLGMVCVLDRKPRNLNGRQRQALVSLSRQVMNLLELRRALEQSRASDEFARSAMESNSDWVSVLDLDGAVISMNAQGLRLMEIEDFSSVINRQWLEFWGSDLSTARAALAAAARGSESRFAGECTTAKGNEKRWEVVLNPVFDPHGKPKRVLCVSRDVTLRRIEEARLQETSRLESLGVLAGGVAHDFNNILTGILGNASLIELSENDEDRELGVQIVSAAERAADLTRQMLAYSGNARVFNERLSLSSVVAEIMGLTESAIPQNVRVRLSLPDSLPMVEVDRNQMQQVVMNLVINAAESMDSNGGSIYISTRALRVRRDFAAKTFRTDAEQVLRAGRYIQIRVRDTGSGMSKKTLERIFEPFFTTKFSGRGLGLAAISGILRTHYGGLRVTSTEGRGTTFRIFIPVAEEPATPSTVSDLAQSSGKQWGTILFTDDDVTVRLFGKESLTCAGYEVLLAENGKRAVDLFSAHRHHTRLIILDLTMPEMGGIEALPLLQAINSKVPILISSGYNQMSAGTRIGKDQVAGFIQKPYTARQLRDAVLRCLAGRRVA